MIFLKIFHSTRIDVIELYVTYAQKCFSEVQVTFRFSFFSLYFQLLRY